MRYISMLILAVIIGNRAYPQEHFLSMEDMMEPTGDWFEAGEVTLARHDERKLEAIQGEGVFINGVNGRTVHLITSKKHGDVKLNLEFMVSKGSNSGVYLQGRYEVQILDSWGREKMFASDCGGIYQRWDETRKGEKGYDGIPPLVNASKQPGEWQSLSIYFKAPRFNKKGKKKRNAKFKKVVLNGIVVQKNAVATGPTRSSLDDLEEPLGHLMLQGDHGPVAYRNISMKKR